mgnify:FL=1
MKDYKYSMIKYFIISVVSLFSYLTASGVVWKGINLDYLTDAYQELVKGYPCEIKFEQYYLNVNFGDLTQGSLEEQNSIRYDEFGYKTKDGDASIKNEYQDGKIIKRTWTRYGENFRVRRYEYDAAKRKITMTEYNQWGLDDIYVYSMVGGKLLLKRNNGSIVQKFNTSGHNEWISDPYNDHITKTYEKGLLRKVSRSHKSTPNSVYSGYEIDSHGNWTRRILSKKEGEITIRGGIFDDMVVEGWNRIQKRHIIYE